MKKSIVTFLLSGILLTGCTPGGEGKKVSFEYPDIKDQYCGVQIDFRMCKCAFHNEYCKELGMSKSEANTKVRTGFDAWVAGQLETFAKQCEAAGGISRDKDQCVYCAEGYVVSNGACKEADAVASENPNCALSQSEYEADWKKYSDIDDAIAFEERSFEAKQAFTAGEKLVTKMVEGFSLERDAELERQLRGELETYSDALVKNLKTNLLKAFWRLSYVTFTTIKSGSGVGESYAKVLDEGLGVETIGAGLKVVQSMVPGNSTLAIDTSEFSGKVKSVSLNTALEAVDTLGDPVAIVTALFNEASGAALPSADITDEEVEILKNQYVTKGVIDAAIAESKAREAQFVAQMAILEQEIATLQQEVSSWEVKEKDRVWNGIREGCEEE